MENAEILQSTRPKWCYEIAAGNKTIEVRKTIPKLKPPFTVLVYCTKNDPRFRSVCGSMVINTDDLYRLPNGLIRYGSSVELMTYPSEKWDKDNFLNGKIIGEYICDYILTFAYSTETGYPTPKYDGDPSFCSTGPGYWITTGELEQTCLTYEELETYGSGKTLYGWHITDFRLYDRPLLLSDLELQKAPQSWQIIKK